MRDYDADRQRDCSEYCRIRSKFHRGVDRIHTWATEYRQNTLRGLLGDIRVSPYEEQAIRRLFMEHWPDFDKVGKRVMTQLPKEERDPFIRWLEHNDMMLELYLTSPGKVLDVWNKSIERYEIKV